VYAESLLLACVLLSSTTLDRLKACDSISSRLILIVNSFCNSKKKLTKFKKKNQKKIVSAF